VTGEEKFRLGGEVGNVQEGKKKTPTKEVMRIKENKEGVNQTGVI
jgi:hypothetical protein